VVKTPPFHGGNTGSNPVRVTFFLFTGGLAQLGEHLPYKQGVGGSIPSSSTTFSILFVGSAQLVKTNLSFDEFAASCLDAFNIFEYASRGRGNENNGIDDKFFMPA
jgi:hypothetical protein